MPSHAAGRRRRLAAEDDGVRDSRQFATASQAAFISLRSRRRFRQAQDFSIGFTGDKYVASASFHGR